ncbi:SusD/RagB family nutrient-binding outer membrane lipoprotein [Chitinophaga nivalis]|uniref:SusD/RagB family nutrient-binding outer membrane lipoprotein n=1 Tax=Chitinophaga nivalis TaxID=2991709 RepID=A0ABT3IX19_9BACT|nr:SusD/RagB family nutrient-binding outer membrane lipoprotein [Chitinophaga nivalis]MCW3462049.1 SusD/RagB family nutrient-binding outer membrane lipoprotein [Chitinophaga nivalis]MCW3488259.1 SusD/RagB family nutrient-binding outer membrane lipoprotein [Chitinophaga nivalis]
MKSFKILSFTALLGIALSSCSKKYDAYDVNPNRPAQVPPSLVLGGVLADMNADKPWSNVMRWNQFDCCNYNYYGDQRYDWNGADFNSYFSLLNVQQMEKEATRLGGKTVNPYTALGKFQRAFFYYRLTNLVGDVPMKGALQGRENGQPVYDNQKMIFIQILQWLEEANKQLADVIADPDKSYNAEGQLLKGDFYFNNDLLKWQRVVNTFRLRVLVALSKKTDDADLKVAQQFKDILGNPAKYPLLEGVDGNLQFIYNNINKYPSNPDNLGNDATRYNMSATYLNTLVRLKDPRAFITAEPATQQLNAFHKTPTDITAYVGALSGESLSDMSSKMSNVDTAVYSVRSRSRYYSSYAAEPGVIVGYPEMCFNIAEAINRGWVTGSAEDWYKKGMKASLAFYGLPVNTAGTFAKTYKGVRYDIPFDFEGGYYTQETVKYKGNNTQGLEQILTQKYLAFFENSGWEAFFNWRRTGVPTFSTGSGTGNSGVIPKRFKYPDAEKSTNTVNWTNALKSQYGGSTDDINATMWLLK